MWGTCSNDTQIDAGPRLVPRTVRQQPWYALKSGCIPWVRLQGASLRDHTHDQKAGYCLRELPGHCRVGFGEG